MELHSLQRQKVSHDTNEKKKLPNNFVGFSIFYFLDYQKTTFSSLPYLELILAFIIFRFFDIVKIGPILWADNLKSGLGVMLDDCLAGCVTFSIIAFYFIII